MSKPPTNPTQVSFPKRLAFAGITMLALIQLIIVGFYFLLRAIAGVEFRYIDILGHLLPWLFLPLVILAPLAVWQRSRGVLITVGILGFLFLITYGQFFLPGLPPRASGPEFSVLTYNTYFRNEQVDQIVGEIERHDADIVGLQEFFPPQNQEVAERLAGVYPYRYYSQGPGIFSRFPIQNCEMTPSKGQVSGWLQRCTLDVHGQPLTVINLHLRRPFISKTTYPGLSVDVITGLDARLNDEDFQTFLPQFEAVEGPLLVMGDLNMTDQTLNYASVSRLLQDAYRERGWGLGFTYTRFGLPVWRIDYIFHSPELVATRAYVGDFGASDHRPVVAELAFIEYP